MYYYVLYVCMKDMNNQAGSSRSSTIRLPSFSDFDFAQITATPKKDNNSKEIKIIIVVFFVLHYNKILNNHNENHI